MTHRGAVGARVDRGLRWYAKKAARHGVAGATGRAGRRLRGVRVLTYHRIARSGKDPFCVTPEAFEAQMAWLARRRLATSLDELDRVLRGGADLRPGTVVVTFDDGCASLVEQALPVLLRHRVPAVAFATASEVGRVPGRLTPSDVRALADAGVEIGSHAWTHRPLGRLAAAEVRREAALSRAALERWSGRPVRAFAYPFGTRPALSAEAAAAVREAGYGLAFTALHGAVVATSDPWSLPRVKVEGGEGAWMFRRLCRGGLDAWRWVDRALWPLQLGARSADGGRVSGGDG